MKKVKIIFYLLTTLLLIFIGPSFAQQTDTVPPFHEYEVEVEWDKNNEIIYIPSDSKTRFFWKKYDGANRYSYMRSFGPRNDEDYLKYQRATDPDTSITINTRCYNIESSLTRNGDFWLNAYNRIIPKWPLNPYHKLERAIRYSVKILDGNPKPDARVETICSSDYNYDPICVNDSVYMGKDHIGESIYLKEWRKISWYSSLLAAENDDHEFLLKDDSECYTPKDEDFVELANGIKYAIYGVRYAVSDCRGTSHAASIVVLKLPELEKLGLPDDVYLVDDEPSTSAGIPECLVPNVTYFPMPITKATGNFAITNMEWKHKLPNGETNTEHITNKKRETQKACVSDIKPLTMRTYQVTGNIIHKETIPGIGEVSFDCTISKDINVHVKISRYDDSSICESINGCENQKKIIDGDPIFGGKPIFDYKWSNPDLIRPDDRDNHSMLFDFTNLPFNQPTLFVLYKKEKLNGEYNPDPFSPQNYCVRLTKNCIPSDNPGGSNKKSLDPINENSQKNETISFKENEIIINGKAEENSKINYTIYSVAGKLVLEGNFNGPNIENRIDISNLQSGIFVLSILNSNSSTIKNYKFLKQ
ncbi:MAG: hypothetical protein ACJATA_001277 [Sphingobacteriales bacterium]|jgi:hypothetical protein